MTTPSTLACYPRGVTSALKLSRWKTAFSQREGVPWTSAEQLGFPLIQLQLVSGYPVVVIITVMHGSTLAMVNTAQQLCLISVKNGLSHDARWPCLQGRLYIK